MTIWISLPYKYDNNDNILYILKKGHYPLKDSPVSPHFNTNQKLERQIINCMAANGYVTPLLKMLCQHTFPCKISNFKKCFFINNTCKLIFLKLKIFTNSNTVFPVVVLVFDFEEYSEEYTVHDHCAFSETGNWIFRRIYGTWPLRLIGDR
jgi:hypothetical protein